MAISREQFEKAYTEFSDAIFRYCYMRVRDRELAKELMQESFMKTWEYNIQEKEIANIKAFVYRTAHNLSLNENRKKGRTTSLDEMSEGFGFEIAEDNITPADVQSDARIATESLKELNVQDATLINLRYVDGLSIREIANITQEQENAVAVRIHRALKKLRKIYTKQ
jgi:RNA polymerase sigma-70 factor (ECF subfamily)